MSAATTVQPTGEDKIIDADIPIAVQIIENTAEHMTTFLKLLNMRIAEIAGNIISADISSDPTRFMAITITTAVITAMSILYASVFTPWRGKNSHQTSRRKACCKAV